MAKPKRGSGGSGLRKNHGPKRHLFKEFKPMVWQFGKLGMLTKYNNYDSWVLACNARGKKNASYNEFKDFVILPQKAKDEYFASLRK